MASAFGTPGGVGYVDPFAAKSVTPTTSSQYTAIQNGANTNSLVNQLYSGNTVTQSPNVIAASSQVKNANAPTSVNTNYQVQPGETTAQYNARIAASNPNLPAPGTTSSTGVTNTVGTLQQTPQLQPPTFPGIIGSLTGAAQQGSAPAQQYTAQTATAGQGNEAIGQSAADIAASYGNKIAALGQQGAMGQAGYLSTGTSPVAEGNAAIVQQTTAARQAALAQGESAALQGTGQQLTAQQQEANALNAAAGQANTSQGLLQTGLTSAGQLSQPSQAAYGQTSFNPLTSSYAGVGDGGLPAATLAQYAQMAASGQYSAIPSSITSNPVLSAQLNAAAKQINPNYNPITSTAQGAAQASNIQTAGTAQTSTAATGYSQAVQTYQNMNTIYQTANGQATNLINDLASTGINSSNSQDFNAAINSLSNRLGSPAMTKISTDIQELQNTYSNLLSTGGGTPTGQEQQALSILNPSSSAAQINQAIQSLSAAAYPKLLAQYQQAQSYQSSLGGSGTNSSSTSSGNTITAGGYTYTKNAQGQWVVAQ